jgi:SAM-dependent methyltransferase
MLGAGSLEKQLQNFWERRAEHYYVPDVFGRRILGAYLIKIKPKSLVEVGCGNGELFSLYKDIPRVVALDWSDEMLKRAQERIARHEYTNIITAKLDITDSHGTDDLFKKGACALIAEVDLVLTRTVLMHIPPEKVQKAIENLTRMSKDVLAFEFYDPSWHVDIERLDWHNWHHEYVPMFKNVGYELVDSFDRPDGVPQILFHFRKS